MKPVPLKNSKLVKVAERLFVSLEDLMDNKDLDEYEQNVLRKCNIPLILYYIY